MNKRILAFTVLCSMCILGIGLGVLGATDTIYTSKWFGYVTDSLDVNKGRNIPADVIRKSVSEKGAKYVLLNDLFSGRYIELMPPEKAAPFAGQQVFVSGSIKTKSLTKSGDAVANSVSGGGRFTIQISSITPHVQDGIY
jgi:hypothetical protein